MSQARPSTLASPPEYWTWPVSTRRPRDDQNTKPHSRWHGARGFKVHQWLWVPISITLQAANEAKRRGRTLIAGPHVLAVIVGPYPARSDAVIPPTAVPEMGAVSTPDEHTAAKSRREVYTRSMAGHDPCAWSMPRHEVPSRVSTATDVSTTAAVSTAVSATTAAVSRGSLCRKRQAAKRENCGQREN
jgi:hypothetical protein